MAQYASYYSSSLSPVSIARVLICKGCHRYIACMDDLLSRAYCGAQSPKAGLFDNVSNVSLGERQVWLMRSGAHTVREMKCISCDAYVGFKIVHAHEPPEQWKNGAYILERQFLYIHSIYEETDEANPRFWRPLKVVDDLRRAKQIKQEDTTLKPVKSLPQLPRSPRPPVSSLVHASAHAPVALEVC